MTTPFCFSLIDSRVAHVFSKKTEDQVSCTILSNSRWKHLMKDKQNHVPIANDNGSPNCLIL